MRSGKSLHHIITEASITKVIKQVIFVCLNNLLYVTTLVIKVAHTSPTFSFVIILTKLSARFSCFCSSRSTVIISTNIRRKVLISHSIVRFCRETKPSIIRSMVIDNHIGNRTDLLIFKGSNHTPQLRFRTERWVLIEVIERIITHRLRCGSLTTLRNPYKVEVTREVIRLLLQYSPLRIIKWIPIKTL